MNDSVVTNQAITVRSFDVFDTLITRAVATPEDVYWQFAARLLPDSAGEERAALVAERRAAEHAAWARGGFRGGIDIDTIHEILAGKMGWNQAQSKRALELEVEIEFACARPVVPVVAHLRRCRDAGQRISYVSDMYLREVHLRKLLQHLGIWRDGDRIFVSSEHNQTKRHRGALFARVLKEHGNPFPGRVQHMGDHRRSDVWMPRLRLLRARHFGGTHLTAAERIVLSHLPEGDVALRSVVCASKFARLRALPSTLGQDHTARLLRDTVAPFIVAYALWLLQRARRDGVRQLFFLARDMRIVHEVASRLATHMGMDVRCQYVFASRAAWQPAGLDPEAATGHRRQLLAYLAQQGYTADHDCALVDSGWRGSLQRTLAGACSMEGGAEGFVRGYYVGLRHAPPTPENCPMHAFLAPELMQCHGYSLVALTEAFLIADHGTTLGYQADAAGRIGAQLASPPSPRVVAQYGAVAEACDQYVDELLAGNALADPAHADPLADALHRPFLNLCASPPRQDARALRDWLFEAGSGQARLSRVASAIGLRDLAMIVLAALRGTSEGDLYLTGPWVRGSLALTNPLLSIPAAGLLQAAQRR